VPVTLGDAQEIVNAQRRYAKPVAIYTPDADAVHEASKIAAEFNGIKFILLNMGGDDWHAAVTAAKRYLNIYVEISGSLDSDKVAHAATVLTPRKLLYGSAMPYSDPELVAGMIDDAPTLTAADRSRVYSQNAAGLFSIQRDDD
jgi:predicted TIM-barrel fold metal-dependent hydrolase